MGFKDAFDYLLDVCEENASAIYIGIGITSFIVAVGATFVEAPKIKRKIDETKEALLEVSEAYDDDELSEEEYKQVKKELYFDCGKTLLKKGGPIVLLTTSGVLCTLNSYNIETNKVTGLATALQISEASKKLYKEKVIEKFGEKKEKEVVDAVHQEEVKRHKKPDEKKIPVLETSKPSTLCFDPYSGRYFRCSVDRIESAINTINVQMLHNFTQVVDLNDFYDEINIPRIKGEVKGWNADRGCFKFRPTSAVTEDNEPCLVVDFDIEPVYQP